MYKSQTDSGFHKQKFPGLQISQTNVSQISESILPYMGRFLDKKNFVIQSHDCVSIIPETKITRYNLRNKSAAMPAIHTDRFKNTFFNRIVFKYNVAL